MTQEGAQITLEAFAAFGAWIGEQPDEIQEKGILELVELYEEAMSTKACDPLTHPAQAPEPQQKQA